MLVNERVIASPSCNFKNKCEKKELGIAIFFTLASRNSSFFCSDNLLSLLRIREKQ